MLRTALFSACLLGLTAATALASPATAQHTPRGLQSQRLTRGNHVPVYKSYRYHSHQDKPLFSFLHFGSHRPAAAAKHHRSARRHTSGIF
jgi:hypothetical protein